jgi:hypothetical protein
MAQRQFWNALLRDAVPFKDLQRTVDSMEATEQRATATYRRLVLWRGHTIACVHIALAHGTCM